MIIKGKKYLVHKSCNTISIYNFIMILRERDYRFLLKSFNEDDNNHKELKDNEDLQAVFDNILNEYNDIIGNNSEKDRYHLLFEIEALSSMYSTGVKIIDMYEMSGKREVLGLLSALDIGYKEYSSPEVEVKKAIKKLKTIKNKLNILRIKYDKKYLKDSNAGNNLDNVIKEIDETAMVFEIDLGLGYKIDIKKTTLLRWANLCKAKKQKDIAYENSKRKQNGKG